MQKRQSFSKEFKLEAVRLLVSKDKPAADLARELGVRRNQLYKWQEQLQSKGEDAFPGKGRRTEKDDNNKRGRYPFLVKNKRGRYPFLVNKRVLYFPNNT